MNEIFLSGVLNKLQTIETRKKKNIEQWTPITNDDHDHLFIKQSKYEI